MNPSKSSVLALLLSLSMAAPALADDGSSGAPQRRHMRLDECVATALEKNVDVRSAREEVTASEAERSTTRGHFGPKLHVDGSITLYDSRYVVLGFPVHDLWTWNLTASVTQPVTALFAIYDAYKIDDLGVDIAAVKREATRRETAFRVVESYYRLLQAERLSEVAIASVDQLNGQLQQAKSFHTNGVVSQDDVLRAQLAVANAQQRLLQINARVTVERSRLALLMGLPPGSELDGNPLPNEQLPAREVLTLEQAEKASETQRIELREVDRRIEQSNRRVTIAKLKLMPQINAVAAYQHNEGSPFAPFNQGFVGATASWDVWDWGTTTSGISLAKARFRQAMIAREKLDDQIRLETRKAFVDVETAGDAVAVAKASVAAAEENFRLVKKRYEASAATSFDVVDAEGLLTQARGQMQTSLYDFMVSRAALRNAMGASPESIARP